MSLPRYGPDNPDATYVPQRYEERLFDTGEASLNYVCAGGAGNPAVLLVPGQTESWWGYESALALLAEHFQVFAVDLRGQGRSSRTPGRYTLDNFGNDLVRLIAFLIRRPVVVSGHSSGGVIAAWLSAYAPPGMVRGALWEDPPLFSSELSPACGPGIRQQAIAALFGLLSRYLGDQWSLGNWAGLLAAGGDLPEPAAAAVRAWSTRYPHEPPQNLKEYDPEWGRAFINGTVGAGCDHARMLAHVCCPVLFTHHRREVDQKSGVLSGATSVRQAGLARELVAATGQPIEVHDLPAMPHTMHAADPALFARLLLEWTSRLPSEAETRGRGAFAG